VRVAVLDVRKTAVRDATADDDGDFVDRLNDEPYTIRAVALGADRDCREIWLGANHARELREPIVVATLANVSEDEWSYGSLSRGARLKQEMLHCTLECRRI